MGLQTANFAGDTIPGERNLGLTPTPYAQFAGLQDTT